MRTNRTFSMIKPGAMAKNAYGEILSQIVKGGFAIKAIKLVQLSEEDAKQFYSVHKGKQFYDQLVAYMCSGPVIALVLEKENAVEAYREFIGNTNPANAAPGTIRNLFGSSVTDNAVHGADSPENAEIEWSFFFSQREILA